MKNIVMILLLVMNSVCSQDLSNHELLRVNSSLIQNILVGINNFNRNHLPAKIMLGEDLSDVIKELESNSSLKEMLLTNFKFKLSNNDRLLQVLELVAKVKSYIYPDQIPAPKFRAELYSRNFSNQIFAIQKSCHISVDKIGSDFSPPQKIEFINNIAQDLMTLNYKYISNDAGVILFLFNKTYSDAGCRGNNRNILESKIVLVNLITLQSNYFDLIRTQSCGYDEIDKRYHLKKINKFLIKNTKDCLN